MAKIAKRISIIIAAIIILLVVIAIVLANVINPNDFKGKIEHAVKQQTGRDLVIKGNISWSFFPWLGFNIKNVQLGNPPNIKGPALASINQLELKLSASSLMVGHVNVQQLQLNGATFNLITNRENKTNWDTWSSGKPQPNTTPKAPSTKQPAKQQEKPAQSASSDFSIDHLKVTNSTINLINNKTGSTTSINKINLTTKDFNSGKNFPVTLSMQFKQSGSKNITQSHLQANANLNLSNGNISIAQLVLHNKVIRPNLPALPITVRGRFSLNPNAQTMSFQKAIVDIANMKLNGDISLSHFSTTPRMEFNLTSKNTKLDPFLKTLNGTSMMSGNLSFNLHLTANGSTSQQMTKTLMGSGKFMIKNGAIKHIDLAYQLHRAQAFLKKQPTPAAPKGPAKTSFSSISANYKINNGIISNQDLKLDGDQLDATGKGQVDLVKKTINYGITVSYQKRNAQPFNLPIMITGNLNKPTVQPDFQAIITDYAKDQLNNFIKKQMGNGKKPKSNIGNTLKGLFN